MEEELNQLKDRVAALEAKDFGRKPILPSDLDANPQAPENAPCAIEGCTGICIGSWVDFSLRRYGVPLCSKHSAMAKRGEIEGELERLNHAS